MTYILNIQRNIRTEYCENSLAIFELQCAHLFIFGGGNWKLTILRVVIPPWSSIILKFIIFAFSVYLDDVKTGHDVTKTSILNSAQHEILSVY